MLWEDDEDVFLKIDYLVFNENQCNIISICMYVCVSLSYVFLDLLTTTEKNRGRPANPSKDGVSV